jgi:hypothetical protein
LRIELRPTFKDEVGRSALPVRRAVFRTIELLSVIPDVSTLCGHHGLRFEKIHGFIEPASGRQIHSVRITRGVRAMCCLDEGPTIILVSLHAQYDKAYRKN